MTYIELINRFWKVNKEVSFTAHETQMYFKLLDTCNSLGWKNPFSQSNMYICGEIGVSEPKLIEVRNKLKQYGLIDFVSGKKKRVLTQYFLLGLTELSLTDSLNSSQTDNLNDNLNGKKCLDNIRHRSRKEKDNTSIEDKSSILPVGDAPKVKPSFIIDEYNRICINLRPVILLTEKRSEMILARVRQHGLENVIKMFENASKSSFLAGQSGNFSADLDWLIRPNNFVKVLEGKYNDKPCINNGNNNRSRDPKIAAEVGSYGKL